jgi:hypothetical protein
MLGDSPLVTGVITNSDGLFAIQLPDLTELTLSLPGEGIFDLPMHAGEPVLVVVP